MSRSDKIAGPVISPGLNAPSLHHHEPCSVGNGSQSMPSTGFSVKHVNVCDSDRCRANIDLSRTTYSAPYLTPCLKQTTQITPHPATCARTEPCSELAR